MLSRTLALISTGFCIIASAAAVAAALAQSAPLFPKPDPANFTAPSPSKDLVDAYLQTNWGYDDNRIWQVQAILKTSVDGVSKIVVFVGNKSGKQQPQSLVFFALPDGKHIITGGQIMPFGARPFADARVQAQQRADGPYYGAAAKDLELVEFTDLQCPHCKEAQANIAKLVADFPEARIVVQNFPLLSIHPASLQATEYGVCVAKLAGSTAFFRYEAAVFDGQDSLGTPDGARLTLYSASTKAGLDPAKVSACATAPETKASVDASLKLGSDLGITELPTLLVNGRPIPANAPYEMLKKIVEFQARVDGLNNTSALPQTGEGTAAQYPSYDSQLARAMALVKADTLVEAESAAAALVRSAPDRWQGYGLEGTVYERENKLIAAKAAYERALQLAPADVKPGLEQKLQNIALQIKE